MANDIFQQNRIFIPNDPFAPTLCPELAAEIGLNESILLLQIAYWIAISNHERDGRRWTYQSTRDIQARFPFWSTATINRTIHALQEKGLIIVANHNEHKYDRTRWFALDPDGLRKLKSIRLVDEAAQGGTRSDQGEPTVFQNETQSDQNETRSAQNETTIPKTTIKNTPNTIPKIVQSLSATAQSPQEAQRGGAQNSDERKLPSALAPGTPGERILFAKLQRAMKDIDPNRRGPRRFGTRQQKEIFAKAEQRLNGAIEQAIDAGLTRGIVSLGPMVAWCAKWNPKGQATTGDKRERDLRDSDAYDAWLK